jgi:antitoxin (DNA-binding transcriptional repressor) of toxin-antitoxin stability system
VELRALVALAAEQVSHVPVARLVPVAEQVSHAPAAVAEQPVAVVAALAAEPLERLARAAAVAKARLANQSARNAKSSNKEVLQALVAQLCHVATAAPAFAFVAARAFKTLPTRSMAMPVN